MAEDTFDTLVERVHNLPPELFENVYIFVFTADGDEKRINMGYKPPAQLQVDRKSREAFAKEYYTRMTFLCTWSRTAYWWLEELTPEHKDQIGRVWLDLDPQEESSPQEVASSQWRHGVPRFKFVKKIVKTVSNDGKQEKQIVWFRQWG